VGLLDNKETLDTLFLHEKPIKILLGMRSTDSKKNYASILAKIADCTYSHTVKILNIFEKSGLIQFNKDGRIKHIVLTKKGEELAKDLDEILKKIKKI
jgi:DNA-binding MarR family transcriptional regulator